MKATQIFNQTIIAHNPSIDDSLDPKTIERLCIHNDRLSYDYERVYNSGKLHALLTNPKKVIAYDIVCRDRSKEERRPGWFLMKGADFIIPLVFLHNALIARLVKDAEETKVIVWPGIRGDVVTDVMKEWEAEGFLKDIEAIYNLHFELTRKFYKEYVEKMTEEDSKKLLKEIEDLDFSVAVLQ